MNTVLERIIKDISSMNIKEIKKENKQKEIYKINILKKEKDKGCYKYYNISQEQFLKYEWSWTI